MNVLRTTDIRVSVAQSPVALLRTLGIIVVPLHLSASTVYVGIDKKRPCRRRDVIADYAETIRNDPTRGAMLAPFIMTFRRNPARRHGPAGTTQRQRFRQSQARRRDPA